VNNTGRDNLKSLLVSEPRSNVVNGRKRITDATNTQREALTAFDFLAVLNNNQRRRRVVEIRLYIWN